MVVKKQSDLVGPELETYIETRLNLLTILIDKLEVSLRERINAVERSLYVAEKSIKGKFEHYEQINKLIQEAAQRTSDKSEKAQHDVNIASNEWRATLNDFKSTVPSRSEFEQLRTEFAAYRLEQSRLNSIAVGTKEAQKENKDDSKSVWALVLAAGSVAVAVATAFLTRSN